MKTVLSSLKPPGATEPHRRSQWPWLLGVLCVLVVLLGIFRPPRQEDLPSAAGPTGTNPEGPAEAERFSAAWRARKFAPPSLQAPEPTAEEIVAGKVIQFGRSRREIVRSIARRTQKPIPPEVEEFFDAIESGNWERIHALGKALGKRSGQYEGSTHWPELDPFWPAVLDAYGVAEQAHLWPARKLLDYGNAILDSLRPGMVYVGGTDPGRWIPELLNETSGGEPRIVVTQNAFADSRYLDFMQTLYGEQFNALTQEESKRAFDAYVADAQKRWEHDQQFPDEPRQVRPGEKVGMTDGRFQVTGQVSVMDINERLLHILMEKNPDLTFAIEQSFPFKSTYDAATPLGPIMELGLRDEQSALTAERAGQTVDYWRAATEQLLSDASGPVLDENLRKAHSKLASNHADLLLNRGYAAEAEQLLRLAAQIAPSSPEAVFMYANLLVGQNRAADAIPIAESALRVDPGNQQFRNLLTELQRMRRN